MAWRVASEEIDRDEQRVLEESEGDVVRLMDVPSVVMTLLQDGVIDDVDVHNILQQRTQVDRVHNFILRLAMRGEKAFHDFLDVLRSSSDLQHVRLAAVLEARLLDTGRADLAESISPRAAHLHVEGAARHDKEPGSQGKAREELERFRTLLLEKEEELDRLKRRLEQQVSEACVVREENRSLRERVEVVEGEIRDVRSHCEHWEKEAKRLKERLELVEEKNRVLEHEHKLLEEEQREEKEQLHSMEAQLEELSVKLSDGDKAKAPPSIAQPANRFQHHHGEAGKGGAYISPTKNRWK